MTILLDQAVQRVRELPEAEQDAIASLLLNFVVPPAGALRLSDSQVEEVRRRQSDYRNGITAPANHDEVAALWARCGI
jgi:hypothetical protein